jgi:hypothetical protein
MSTPVRTSLGLRGPRLQAILREQLDDIVLHEDAALHAAQAHLEVQVRRDVSEQALLADRCGLGALALGSFASWIFRETDHSFLA